MIILWVIPRCVYSAYPTIKLIRLTGGNLALYFFFFPAILLLTLVSIFSKILTFCREPNSQRAFCVYCPSAIVEWDGGAQAFLASSLLYRGVSNSEISRKNHRDGTLSLAHCKRLYCEAVYGQEGLKTFYNSLEVKLFICYERNQV